MPDLESQRLVGSVRPPNIFASASSDPPFARTSRRLRVAAIAMAFAAAIWLLVAAVSLGAGAPIDLLIMAILGSAFDAFVALQLWQQRWSKVILVYVCVRAVLAAVGFVLICLPAYLVALLAVPTRPQQDDFLDRNVPHAFRPKSSGWLSDMAPIRTMSGFIGAGMLASRNCVCGEPEDAPVHTPPEPPA